jgi:hypothetical protein
MTMNCDQATELLPWLVNDTLEAGERQQVLQHVAGCARCRAALADTRTVWRIFDWHPSAAELIAYTTQSEGGAVAASVHARGVEEHLAACPACAAELELVRAGRLLSDPAADERIALLPRRRDDAAARRTWRRSALAASVVGVLALSGWFESSRHARSLEERLAATSAARGATPVSPTAAASSSAPAPSTGARSDRGMARPGPGGTPPPLAAASEAELRRRADEAQAKLEALARENQQLEQKVTSLGRSASELERRARTAGLEAPAPRIEGYASLSELKPAEQVERGTRASLPSVIPLSAGTATLLLQTRHRGTYPDYQIEIHDSQDRLVGGPIDVHRLPQGQDTDSFEDFGVTLRRGALPPGDYTIRLFGRTAHPETPEKARVPLETYSLRIS